MQKRGQGAMEYMLLIGGAVLVATVILLILLSSAPAGGTIITNYLGGYDDIGLDDAGTISGPPPVDFEDELVLDNDEVSLEFDETPAGDVILSQVIDDSGAFFSTSGSELWNVIMVDPATFSSIVNVSPSTSTCDPVQYSEWTSGSTKLVEWYWNHCLPVATIPTEYINVKIRVELQNGSSISRWTPSVENHSSRGIHRVDLKLNIYPHSSSDRYLLTGTDGLLVQDPVNALAPYSQSLHIEFTQLHAWYDPLINEGLYIATQDPRNGRSKFTSRETDGTKFTLTLGAFGEEPLTTKSFTVPYSTAIGTFSGDWYDAAQIYRKWVESNNVITSAGKLKDRTDVPAWYKELGLQLIQNYGINDMDIALNPNAISFFENIKDYYLPCAEYHTNPSSCVIGTHADQPLSLFQWSLYDSYYNAGTWEELKPGGGSDGYGEYPVIDRIEPFISALDAKGVYVEGYTQPGIFSSTGPGYASIASQSQKKIDGTTLLVSAHPSDPIESAVMDPASTIWHTAFATKIRDNLVQKKGHGIYMDNPYANYGVNFSNTITPPHTKGKGGTHFYEGYRNMMITTRTTARAIDPNFILFHEQGMEAYVGASDSFSNSGTNSPAPVNYDASKVQNVPLIETLYHDYQLFNSSNSNPDWSLGHYNFYQGSDIAAFLESIQVNTAIGFNYGRMINSAEPFLSFNQPNHVFGSGQMSPYTGFLKNLIKVRKSAAKDYLIYGQLVRPLPNFGTQTTYTYKDVYNSGSEYTITVPDVLSSVWKASDDSLGIVLVNPTNTDRTVTIPFNPTDYGLSGGVNYSELNQDNPTAHVSQFIFNKPFSGFGSPITISARSVRVIRVA